jgi:hypothetical protein
LSLLLAIPVLLSLVIAAPRGQSVGASVFRLSHAG